MKKLSECELPFQDLNEIPRSSRKKQQTFHKIMHDVSTKTETKRTLIPNILTVVVSLAACFLFAFIIFTETNNSGSTNIMTSIEGKEITEMGLALSKSKTTFVPIEEVNKKNIFIISDENWNKAMYEMIRYAEIGRDKPMFAPTYDLLITLGGHESLKIKVWIEEEGLYFKDLGKEEYYYVSKEKSEEIKEFMKSLQDDIQAHY